MSVDDNTDLQTSRWHHHLSKTAKINIAIILLVALVAGVGAWHYKPAKKTSSLAGEYSKLANVKLAADQKVAGMSYDRPAQFKQPEGVNFDSQLQAFTQIKTLPDGNRIQIGGEASYTAPFSAPQTSTDLKKWQAAIDTGNFDRYKPFFDSFDLFLKFRIGEFDIAYGVPKAMITDNIKAGAVKFDFQAQPKAQFAKEGFVPLRGIGVIDQTAKNTYNFVVYSSADTWSNNSDAWNAILNSLKVEQP